MELCLPSWNTVDMVDIIDVVDIIDMVDMVDISSVWPPGSAGGPPPRCTRSACARWAWDCCGEAARSCCCRCASAGAPEIICSVRVR